MDYSWDVVSIKNEIVVLGDGAGDLNNGRLLKGMGANHVAQREAMYRLVAPGPEVAMQTPGQPEERA